MATSYGGITAGGNVGAALNQALTGPVNSFNDFMGRINDAIDNPLGSLGDIGSMLGKANPYAKQNTLHVMQQRGEPVLAFEWLAVILDPNPTTALPWYYIDTFQTPGMQVSANDYQFNGIVKKAAGIRTIDSLNVGLFTDNNATTFNYADAWFNSTFRKDGYYNLPSQYKRDIVLYILDSKRKTVIDIRFVGCWITSYNSYSFSGDNGVVETQLALSVDHVIFNTESSLSRAAARFKSQWPGVLSNAGASLLNIPNRG